MRHSLFRGPFTVAAMLLAIAASATAHAATLRVATNGIDDERCGRPTAPCATLQTAVENADDGDTILVGPGRYESDCGDFGCCAIRIDKDVSIRSIEGAEATHLIGDDVEFLVCIEADGVTFGLDTKGFLLTGAYNGLAIGDVSDAYVGGNISLGNFEDGFTASGTGHTFFRNLALDNGEAGFDMFCRDSSLSRNRAITNLEDGFRFNAPDAFNGELPNEDNTLSFNIANHNGDNGFFFESDTAGNTADRNAASMNDSDGFELRGTNHTVRRLVAVGNGDQGINVYGSGHELVENHLIVSNEYGIRTQTAAVTITRNNFFGNREDDADDCQLRNVSGVEIQAPDNFFGVPVPDAGTICGDPIDRDPISTTEFSSAFGWLPVP